MSEIWYDENSHRLMLHQLSDPNGNPVNDAAVSCTMLDGYGGVVPGIPWPTAMVNDGGGTGTYTADLPKSLEVEVGDRLSVVVEAVKAGSAGKWTCSVVVKNRGC
jgi:hypothetical protein